MTGIREEGTRFLGVGSRGGRGPSKEFTPVLGTLTAPSDGSDARSLGKKQPTSSEILKLSKDRPPVSHVPCLGPIRFSSDLPATLSDRDSSTQLPRKLRPVLGAKGLPESPLHNVARGRIGLGHPDLDEIGDDLVVVDSARFLEGNEVINRYHRQDAPASFHAFCTP